MNKCIISEKETFRKFKGTPIHEEVMEFARQYRDALNLKNTQGVLIAFITMKTQFNHSWESIKKKLIKELLDKGISL
jgi:hypothetical protein